MSDKYFDDYQPGQTRTTHGRTITEADVVLHAGHSGDYFPHHVDESWCRTQPFGQRIAHGTMTFTIGVGLTATQLNPRAMTYGYDRLRFPRPVHIGDTIRTRLTIGPCVDDPKRPERFGRVTEKLEVLNQHDQCVLACDHILLVHKRDANADASTA